MSRKYWWLYLAVLVGSALASVGDALPEFEDCLELCQTELCLGHDSHRAKNFDTLYQDNTLLRLLWPCEDDCTYQCVQIISDVLERQKDPMVQFHGKWPLYRIFGIQEVVSMLFLVANLYANARSWRFVYLQYKKSKRTGFDTMYAQVLLLIAILVIGWLFSTIFHTRDVAVTETLDYFGAFAIVCLNFNLAITRIFKLFEPKRRLLRQTCQLMIFIGYCAHCLTLLRDWDYGFNTLVSVIMGLICLTLWVMHGVHVNQEYHNNYASVTKSGVIAPFESRVMTNVRKVPLVGWWAQSHARDIGLLPIFLHLFILTGLSLELLEFEPWFRLIDAHSLWHLVTFFAPFVWYDWLIWEIELHKSLVYDRAD